MRALARRLQRVREERGVVLPMVALLMFVIVGMTAFAIDLSGYYFDQRHLQMQADSAVLAGANQFVQGITNCSANTPSIQNTAANYADASGAPAPITSNAEKGTVTINTSVSCGGSQGAYVDSTVTNSNPSAYFSGIFGIHPSISAHARASLEQVTEEGGSQVMPYAITQSQATYNNQLIQITVNAGAANASQSLVCDGSGGANTTSNSEMVNFEENGCPLTQVNPGGGTCPQTQLTPPSCLWEFTGVDEAKGYDTGEVYHFESGSPWPNTDTCTHPNPIPTNNYAQYQANGTIVPGDPRIVTVYVVPNGSFSTTTHLIPVIGYAEFYAVGWDHDPCVGPNGTDPANPGPGGAAGSIWGYFISYVSPESSNVQGSGPCNPNPSFAYTYNCTYALTQ
jgi:hypothetical protein